MMKLTNISGTTFYVTKRYEFIKVIGQGAYGVVVSAYDKLVSQKVAIKKVCIPIFTKYK
jgi:serine/threonine protein kinase